MRDNAQSLIMANIWVAASFAAPAITERIICLFFSLVWIVLTYKNEQR